MKHEKQPATDPDIWTVLSLVISTVSMVAQLAGLKGNAPAKGIKSYSTNVAHEKIRDEIELAIRNCEKLVKLLGNASGEAAHPLDSVFKFGQSRAWFSEADIQRYGELVSQIAMNAGNLSVWTLNLIQNDPGFAEEIGNKIMIDALNVQQRINDLFRGDRTNQEVLDECLFLLRTFNQLLGSFEQRRN